MSDTNPTDAELVEAFVLWIDMYDDVSDREQQALMRVAKDHRQALIDWVLTIVANEGLPGYVQRSANGWYRHADTSERIYDDSWTYIDLLRIAAHMQAHTKGKG